MRKPQTKFHSTYFNECNWGKQQERNIKTTMEREIKINISGYNEANLCKLEIVFKDEYGEFKTYSKECFKSQISEIISNWALEAKY